MVFQTHQPCVTYNLGRKMNPTVNQLDEILRRHSIEDAETFILEKGKSTNLVLDSSVRGNVQLIKKRIVNRADVDKRLRGAKSR